MRLAIFFLFLALIAVAGCVEIPSASLLNAPAQSLSSFMNTKCDSYPGEPVYDCGDRDDGSVIYCIDTSSSTCAETFASVPNHDCSQVATCGGSGGFDCDDPPADDGDFVCSTSFYPDGKVFKCIAGASWNVEKSCTNGCAGAEDVPSSSSDLCAGDSTCTYNGVGLSGGETICHTNGEDVGLCRSVTNAVFWGDPYGYECSSGTSCTPLELNPICCPDFCNFGCFADGSCKLSPDGSCFADIDCPVGQLCLGGQCGIQDITYSIQGDTCVVVPDGEYSTLADCEAALLANCLNHDLKQCYGGNVYWYDSCGNRQEKQADCPVGCSNGICTSTPTENVKCCQHDAFFGLLVNYVCATSNQCEGYDGGTVVSDSTCEWQLGQKCEVDTPEPIPPEEDYCCEYEIVGLKSYDCLTKSSCDSKDGIFVSKGTCVNLIGEYCLGAETPASDSATGCVEEDEVFFSNGFLARADTVLYVFNTVGVGRISRDVLAEADTVIPSFSTRYKFNKDAACCEDLRPLYRETNVETMTDINMLGLLPSSINKLTYDEFSCQTSESIETCPDFIRELPSKITFLQMQPTCTNGWGITVGIFVAFMIFMAFIGGRK